MKASKIQNISKTFYLYYTEKGYQEIKIDFESLLRKYVLRQISSMLLILIRMFVLTNMESLCPRAQNKRRVETSCSELLEAKKWRGFVPEIAMQVVKAYGMLWEGILHWQSYTDVTKKKKNHIHEYSVDLQSSLLKEDKRKIYITALQWNASRLFTNIPWMNKNPLKSWKIG